MNIHVINLIKVSLRPVRAIIVSLQIATRFFLLGFARVSEIQVWITKNYEVPVPQIIKWSVLRRWGGAGTWIETGTYMGETTKMLSTIATFVYSIEPMQALAQNATKRFQATHNIAIIEGRSEIETPRLLESLNEREREDISFWLDGHFSSGSTYMGVQETPIIEELTAIAFNLPRFKSVTVLVDDVRCFNSKLSDLNGYPDVSFLSSWAEENSLTWTIEYDIFIATKNRIAN